jgi:methylamine dehydrogenase accessory protein MauD
LDGWWAASYIALWLFVIVLAIVVAALARQIGTLHLRLGPRGALELDDEGPALGEMLPATDAVAVDGETVSLGGPGEAQLLLFVSPGCGVCEQVLPSVPVIAQAGRLSPYVLTDVDAEETDLVYRNKKLGVPLVPASEAVLRYGIPGTPYVVVTDATGTVRAKGTVNNLEQMEGLVDSADKRSRADA